VSDNLELVSCGIRYVNNIRACENGIPTIYILLHLTHSLALVALFPWFGSYGDRNFVAQ
jgi:hypothetical protein